MAVTTPAGPRVATQVRVPPAPIRTPRSSLALLVALVAVCLYAVFAHGAVGIPEEPRLQIGLALVGVGAAVGLLLTRTLSLRASTEVWIGVGLLAGFTVWCGITMFWSVTPDRTWEQVNRGVAYVLIVVLALALASSMPRAIERLAYGWLFVALVCALYALAGKIMPGVALLGVDFNHTEIYSRLRAPLEYWNALALVMVLAIPIALRIATDPERRDPVRLLGLAALFALVVTLGMTYSRGGVLALFAAVTVMTVLGGQRLRGLAVVGVVIVASIPVLGLSFSRPALKGIHVPLDERIPDGILLGMVAAGSLIALLIAGWGMLRLKERTAWDDERTQLTWRGLGALAAILGLMLLGGIASYDGGPRGWADDAWHKFTETTKDNTNDPARLTSSNSGNRWVWWKEAAGAWSDKPIQGWGAGSFPVTHRLYRQVDLPVVQPHNMPLQFLAEEGIVGLLLVSGALGFLLFCAVDRVRALAAGRERDFAVALLAGAVGWLVHGLVDWDWDIPGVTIPALLFLGVLAGTPWKPRSGPPPLDRTSGTRGGLLALACVAAGVVVVSAGLPLIADEKASSSQAVSVDAGAAELQHAAAEADLAARLDPTAIRPLLASAAIAEGRDRLLDARRFLLQAVERQPYSVAAWQRLVDLAIKMADRPGADAAARRLRELDPIGTTTLVLASRIALFEVAAASSPTATGTPLSPRYDAGQAVAPTPGTTGTTGTATPGTTGTATPGTTGPATPGTTGTRAGSTTPGTATPGTTSAAPADPFPKPPETSAASPDAGTAKSGD